MNRWAKLIVLSLSFVIFSYVAVGFLLAQSSVERAYRSLTVFSEVLQHIQQDYVEEPNLPTVTSGALRGLLESMDAHSAYLSPREYAEYKRQTEKPPKGDVGVALSKRFGYIAVIAPLPDSPAARAGVRAGDIMENIAGFTTREMSIGQAATLLAGEPGTAVKVAVVRRGRSEPQEIDIVRAPIAHTKLVTDRFPDAGSSAAESTVVYLRVPALTAGKSEEMRAQLAQFERHGYRKLVLDLRDCASGEAAEGISAARLFLESGSIATLRGQTVAKQDFAADAAKVAWKHSVIVLISASTSGPAEILAAAIADNKRGQTVGDRTFGTASQQKLIPLDDGAAIVLTVAKYYTPGGKAILDDGIEPTVAVAERDNLPDEDQIGTIPNVRDNDDVLKKAVEILKTGVTPPAGKSSAQVAPVRRTRISAAT